MNVLWATVFLFILILFFLRFVVSSECRPDWIINSVGCLIGCLIILYVSFIIEGIILAISKIEDFDDEAMIKAMRIRYGPYDTAGQSLSKIKARSGEVLIGQPLFAIAITFAFSVIFKVAGLSSVMTPPKIPAWEYLKIPQWEYFLCSNDAVTLLVSTMLIYWVAQILPQLLAKEFSIEFMRHLPGARHVAVGLTFVAKTGVGLPGNWMKSFIQDKIFNRDKNARLANPE